MNVSSDHKCLQHVLTCKDLGTWLDEQDTTAVLKYMYFIILVYILTSEMRTPF